SGHGAAPAGGSVPRALGGPVYGPRPARALLHALGDCGSLAALSPDLGHGPDPRECGATRRLRDSGRGGAPAESLYDASPPGVVGGAGALCAGALPAGAHSRAPPLRVLSVRGWAAPVSGPGAGAADVTSDCGTNGADLPPTPGPGPPRPAGP